ncbi:uncharacterized protein ARMOST_18551 [Armillaria ostoyae]|uniref:Uncharacterized protein n=1 Tax=Armillaria ostoyae TaxID=47428 RepID=A0A284S266_ARMOS|nr:uncharacterized protein ARMOST_18551 [Armillaria ostoyae]
MSRKWGMFGSHKAGDVASNDSNPKVAMMLEHGEGGPLPGITNRPNDPGEFEGRRTDTLHPRFVVLIPPFLENIIFSKMTDGPLMQIFSLAPEEEDTMKTFLSEYWDAYQLGGDALDRVRLTLWKAWLAKFPITFIALAGRYSTKEDEEFCWCKKLACIEEYLLHLGTLTNGYGLEVIARATANLAAEVLKTPAGDVTQAVPALRLNTPLTIPSDPPLLRCSPRILARAKPVNEAVVVTPARAETSSKKHPKYTYSA